MTRQRTPQAIAIGRRSCARACRAEDYGFQTAHRGETAAANLVCWALIAAMSLFAAEALLHSRALF